MKPEARRNKCLHCQLLFVPDYRNRGRQKYCATAACQQVSKRARQARWLGKPENRDHFRGAENVQQVQAWRQAHPGYWRRAKRKGASALQDACPAQTNDIQTFDPILAPVVAPVTLQDVCAEQVPLMVGLIAKFTDCTLQDDIVLFVRCLIAKGQDILDQPSSRFLKGNTLYDEQKDPAPGTLAASAGAV